MEKEQEICLIRTALQARERAYAPYSHYKVGAAILTEQGEIFDGCNVENASYGAAICAERCAVTKAVSTTGTLRIKAVAVVGGPEDCHGEMPEEAPPCGICRQVLREFAVPGECVVLLAKSEEKYRGFTLQEILPESFGPEKL